MGKVTPIWLPWYYVRESEKFRNSWLVYSGVLFSKKSHKLEFIKIDAITDAYEEAKRIMLKEAHEGRTYLSDDSQPEFRYNLNADCGLCDVDKVSKFYPHVWLDTYSVDDETYFVKDYFTSLKGISTEDMSLVYTTPKDGRYLRNPFVKMLRKLRR